LHAPPVGLSMHIARLACSLAGPLTHCVGRRSHCPQACCGVDGGPDLPDFDPVLNISLVVTSETCSCDLADTYGAAATAGGSIGPCQVPILPNDAVKWSHSSSCANYIYVQSKAQVLGATWGSLSGLSILILLPMLGKIADLYGRQKVYYWTTVSTVAMVSASLPPV